MCRVFPLFLIAMDCIVGVPEPEAVIQFRAQVLFDLCAIPIGLPGKSILVQKACNNNHLSFELSALERSGTAIRNHRADELGPLRVKGFAVRPAELIPDVKVGSRDLVPMIGLSGKEV